MTEGTGCRASLAMTSAAKLRGTHRRALYGCCAIVVKINRPINRAPTRNDWLCITNGQSGLNMGIRTKPRSLTEPALSEVVGFEMTMPCHFDQPDPAHDHGQFFVVMLAHLYTPMDLS